MAPVESQPLVSKPELVRWCACGVFVLILHGFVALAVAARTDETDLEAGAPVVMIDLAPLAVARPTPVSDLAPGPLQAEPESQERVRQEEQREQKEPEQERVVETPAPDPTATVAAAVEPSKLPLQDKAEQDPVEQAPVPTAPPSIAALAPRLAAPAVGRVLGPSAPSIVTWQKVLRAHLDGKKQYPSRAQDEHGVATLGFSMDREGRVLTSRIVRSSGSSVLDEETLALIKRAQPLPRPPAELADDQLSFTLPVEYRAAKRQ